MARSRHGLGKRLALRLVTVAGFAATAWAIGSGAAHAAAPNAVPQPSLVTVLDELLGEVLGMPPEQAAQPPREAAVPRARIVPMKPLHRPDRHVAFRPVLMPSDEADPITSVVVPLLSPVIDTVAGVTEPVVRAVEPIAKPLLAIPLTQARELHRAVGEAFVAVVNPEPDAAARPLAREQSRSEVHRHRATVKRVLLGELGRVHPITSAGSERLVEVPQPYLPKTSPLGGRTPMDASALAAPGRAQAGVLPAAPELAEPGEVALRSAAHRAVERSVGDAPTSSPD